MESMVAFNVTVVAGSDATEPIQDWNTISSFYKGQPEFSSAH